MWCHARNRLIQGSVKQGWMHGWCWPFGAERCGGKWNRAERLRSYHPYFGFKVICARARLILLFVILLLILLLILVPSQVGGAACGYSCTSFEFDKPCPWRVDISWLDRSGRSLVLLLLVLCRAAFTPHNRTLEVRPGIISKTLELTMIMMWRGWY